MSLLKKLTSAVVASSLVLGVAGSAFAADAAQEAAANRMKSLNLIQGNNGDLMLDTNITRAEFVTVMVRAFGQEGTANLVKGVPTGFADVAPDAWYSGYVLVAKNLIEANGHKLGVNAEGTAFAPNQQISAAEAVAFMMKFLGVQRNASLAWPQDYLVAGVEAGVISAADKAAIDASTGATTRGFAFKVMDHGFYNYKLASGKTVYTTIDQVAPTVAIDALASNTTTNSKITITGSASGFESLMIDSGAGFEALTVDAAGKFSKEVTLKMGVNDIVVNAVDAAGNATSKSVTVSFVAGAAATIKGEAITVAAGQTVDVDAIVADANGNNVAEATAELTGESTLGTFEDGKFTAGTTAGTGKLTLTYGELTADINVTVTAGELASVGVEGTAAPGSMVQLVGKDAHGNTVEGVTFSKSGTGYFLDADGSFIAEEAGTYTVTATKGDVTVQGTVGVYGDFAKLVVSAPENIVANNATEYTVSVKAVDENGNVVADYDEAIEVDGGGLTVDTTDSEWKDGVYSFVVTAEYGLAGGEYDITATSDDVTGTTTVNAVAQVASKLQVTIDDYLANQDGEATGRVRVLDQLGKPMDSTQSWTVDLKVAGPAALTEDGDEETTVVATGTYTSFTIYSIDTTQIGTATVTASYGDFEAVKDTISVVNALDASKLVLTPVTTEAVAAGETEGGVYVYKLQLTDKNGVPRFAEADLAVDVTYDTDDADQLYVGFDTSSSNVDAADEVETPLDDPLTEDVEDTLELTIPAGASTVYIGVKGAQITGTVPFEATATDLAKATGSIAFKAGEETHVEFTRNNTVTTLANTATKLTVQLKDEAGNAVAKAGVKVQFAPYAPEAEDYIKLNGASAGKAVVVETDENGRASVEASLMPYYGNNFVAVLYDFDGDGKFQIEDENEDTEEIENEVSDLLEIALSNRIASSMTVTTWEGEGRKSTFEAGDEMTLRVQIKDNNGIDMAALVDADDAEEVADFLAYADANVKVDGIELGDDVEETLIEWQYSAEEGLHAVFHAVKAGSYTISVQDVSVANEVKATRAVSFVAGAANHLVITDADSTGEIDAVEGKVKALTVQVVDQYGNAVNAQKVTKAIRFTATPSGEAGTYADVRSAENSGYNDTFKIGANRTTTTIYVVADGDFTLTLALADDEATEADEAWLPELGSPDFTYTVNVEEE